MFKHMVNPALIFGITPGFATASVCGYNDAKKERNQIRQEKQQAAEQVVEQEAAAEKNDFLNQLDEKRRRGRRTSKRRASLPKKLSAKARALIEIFRFLFSS